MAFLLAAANITDTGLSVGDARSWDGRRDGASPGQGVVSPGGDAVSPPAPVSKTLGAVDSPAAQMPSTEPVQPAPQFAFGIPRVSDAGLIGNCSGLPSPGETVAIRSTLDYAVAEDQTLTSGVEVVVESGASPPHIVSGEKANRFDISGVGSLAWTDEVLVPSVPAGDPDARIRVSTWAMPSAGLPVRSGFVELELGSTVRVRAVDDAGTVVHAALSMTNGGCWRTRGANLEQPDGRRVAFYHVDPQDTAEVLVTSEGYWPAKVRLLPGQDLVPGAIRDIDVVLKPRLPYAALQSDLDQLVAGFGGLNAVTVVDLQTGRVVAVNGTREQYAACTVKIMFMIAVAQDIEAGLYTKDDVADLVWRAMGPSQVWPARELISIIGAGDVGRGIRRMNKIMWDLGATHSIVTHPPGYYWEEYGYLASHNIVENLATTDDMALILSKLYRGEILPPAGTEYVLWSMTLGHNAGLSGSLGNPLPWDVTLYQKMGQLDTYDGTWNDVGIAVFERGGREYAYAIAYLGSLAGWRYHYNYGSQLSGVTWRAFDAAYSGR